MSDTTKTYAAAKNARAAIIKALRFACVSNPIEGDDFDLRETDEGRIMPIAYFRGDDKNRHKIIGLAHKGFRVEDHPDAHKPAKAETIDGAPLRKAINRPDLPTCVANAALAERMDADAKAEDEAPAIDPALIEAATQAAEDARQTAANARAETKAKRNAPREGSVNRRMFDAALSPEGVTPAELREISGLNVNFTEDMKRFAQRYGLTMHKEYDASAKRRTIARYFLRQPEDAQAA